MCRQAVDLMTAYLEGSMARRDRARLEAHLAGCPHCTEYLAQLRQLITVAGHVDPDDLAPEALDELTDLYRRWRDDA